MRLPPTSTLFPYTTLFRSSICVPSPGPPWKRLGTAHADPPMNGAAAGGGNRATLGQGNTQGDRKSTRLNSSHVRISYAVFCLKKKKKRTPGHPDIANEVQR